MRRHGPRDETASIGPSIAQRPLAFAVTLSSGTFTYALPKHGTIRIGRSEECEISIDDHAISWRHAIVHLDRIVGIEDNGSRNGTIVLGVRIAPHERTPLPLGAVVEIGHSVLVLMKPHAEAPNVSAASVVIESGPMRELWATLPTIASSPLGVLILGETGAGKDVIARALHDLSTRAKAPFVALNCAALSETTLESELFGHVRGAFTGAVEAKMGLFEAAHRGTLFLDEVGDMSQATQAKLLRAVETGEVLPMGSVKPKRIDVRLVAATNRELRSLVRQGRFREDLYFRLQGVTIHVPPLRERKADIAPLVERFAGLAAAHCNTSAPRFDDDAMSALNNHAWPGNVRELRSVVERAVMLSRGARVLGVGALRLDAMKDTASTPGSTSTTERDRMVAALERAAGNQTVAAKSLGVSRRTFIRRMQEYGIARPRKDAS
jgi:two-component system response regulator AtoC